MATIAEKLESLGACSDARAWVGQRRSPQKAWDECERGDWLLWLLAKTGADRKLLVRLACECARLALPHVPAGEDRPLRAIETAEKWARGEGSIKDVRRAANAAVAAAPAAAHRAGPVNANAAAAAANAAADAANAYAVAYAAANAAADAAYAAADAAASAKRRRRRREVLRECADIVRRHVPTVPEV